MITLEYLGDVEFMRHYSPRDCSGSIDPRNRVGLRYDAAEARYRNRFEQIVPFVAEMSPE